MTGVGYILLFVIYIGPALFVYIWTRLSYSKRGIRYPDTPSEEDVGLVLIPFLNFVAAFLMLFHCPIKTKRTFTEIFFGIKPNK